MTQPDRARTSAPDASLERLLLERLRRVRLPSSLDAVVSMDMTDGRGWSFHLRRGRLWLSAGIVDDADTTIAADSGTLASLLEGEVSGIEAFVEGHLRVRGNLSLSLRLGGLLGAQVAKPAYRALDVEVDGISTFYLEAGEGPAIVMLHGLGATNASLLPTFRELANDHRVIAPDLPGFGDSDKPIRSYNAAFYADWLVKFLDTVGVEKAHLLGNSMGGRVAIEGALVAPERIGKLALLAPSPAFIKYRTFTRLVRVLRAELALVPLPMPRSLVLRELRRMFSRPERLEDAWYEAAADEFLRAFSSPSGRIAFFSAARQIYLEEPYGEDGFWDRLGDLTTPSLFIWGDRDRLVPAGFARHVSKALPAASSVVLEDCGHVPQYEHPERTHALIRDFLSD